MSERLCCLRLGSAWVSPTVQGHFRTGPGNTGRISETCTQHQCCPVTRQLLPKSSLFLHHCSTSFESSIFASLLNWAQCSGNPGAGFLFVSGLLSGFGCWALGPGQQRWWAMEPFLWSPAEPQATRQPWKLRSPHAPLGLSELGERHSPSRESDAHS